MTNVKIQPRLPKGMRDFLPQEMLKRNYVFDVVREVFHLYGFEPLQTPVLELGEILMGKYGEDAEKLIYHAQHPGGKEELALRYDLTVPLARVIGQYPAEITLPFKRYQLAPVWRAERPQRGRYREFYQCDVDIVGIADMSADAEVIGVVVSTLKKLGFPQFAVKINNRKLLTAIGHYSGVPDSQLGDLYRSVDKFDKIGAEGVRKELVERGVNADAVAKMMGLIVAHEPGLGNLDVLEQAMGSIPAAQEGIRELRELAAFLEDMYISQEDYAVDFTMVRGLGYYTGPIFETVIEEPNLGSVSGGGRYDDLVGLFRKETAPTTGVSLGIERIIDLMDILNLYPAHINKTTTQILVTVFSQDTRSEGTRLTAQLRQRNINTELYLKDEPLGRQIQYATNKNIPAAIIQGPEEIENQTVTIRYLPEGYERTLSIDEILNLAEMNKLLEYDSKPVVIAEPLSSNHNLIYFGNNLEILRNTPEFSDESIDLVYLDPSNDRPGISSDGKNMQSELLEATQNIIGGNDFVSGYLEMLAPRLIELKRVLKPTGTLWLQCETAQSHYLRLLLDEIFGSENFRNEIIWNRGQSASVITDKKHYPNTSETIFAYSKGENYTFNLQNKQPLSNVWNDIDPVFTHTKERLNYPPQKPVALLERIIATGSNPGDTVLDPFMGSGTTIVAAHALGRKWIGIDNDQTSIAFIQSRLRKEFDLTEGTDYVLIGQPYDLDEAKKLPGQQFEKWVLALIKATPEKLQLETQPSKGDQPDGIITFKDERGKTQNIVVEVKRRMTTDAVKQLQDYMQRSRSALGLILTLEPPSVAALKIAADAGTYQLRGTGEEFPRIQIVNIEDVVKGTKINIPNR